MNLLSKVSLVALACLSVAMAQETLRRPAPAAALPAPAAAGPLRILLVDDDFSDNNNNPKDTRQTPSDVIFRKVIANAVGGNAKAWEIEYVKPYESGPGIDRLRPFSLIVWYTGAIYGGNPDNSGVLSVEDEKVVRRYLEEVGGTVILFSPGYLSKVLGASGTWEKGGWPFLSEVIGARGGTGLAQRFLPGTVTAPDGAQFNVDKGTASVESQFSLLNPDGATVLFTTVPAAAKPGSSAAPVATSNAYGRGRFIYIGFTFENLGAQEQVPMFGRLLAASGLQSKAGAGPAVAAAPAAAAAPTASAPVAEPAAVQVTGTPAAAEVRWKLQTATLTNASLGGAGLTSTRVQPRPAATQAAPAKVERLVPNGAPVRLTVATADATRASDTGPFAPGKPVTYRVTLTDAQGRSGYKEASFTPQARDPDSLTAAVQADSTVVLVWPEVPGVLSYQVSGTALATPVTVNRATEWRSPRVAGSHQWRVASVYAPGGVLTASSAWPSATSRVIPVPGRPFLSMPNGAGSYAFTEAHYRSQCIDALAPGSLCHAADLFNAATNWEEAWLAWNGVDDAPAKWPRVFSFSRLDLGVYRQSNCAPPKNGSITCWAISHRDVERKQKPESLSFIVMNGDKSFFGVWEFPGQTLPETGWRGSAFDVEHSFAIHSTLVAGSVLDSQGRKNVPHACLSCHGGYYDPTSRRVVGASLLPMIPARMTPDIEWDAVTRVFSGDEENTRALNQIVLQSNPAPAIIDQIAALYDGQPNTPGKRANNTAVPSGWRTQQGLYKKVIEPYCSSCHFAQRGPFNLRSWGNALQNKAAIQRTMCTDFTMPHSEIQFRKFWSEDNGAAPRLLSTALGFQTCG